MKAALYARYSSDLQSPTSITGQFRNAESLATQHGLTVVARFEDRAISGCDDNRPGYLALLAAAERTEFDAIVIDETSRLTRSPWELPRIIEELAFRGQFLLAKGFDSRQDSAHLLAGVYAGIDRLELQKIKARTHRGLRERHINGFSAGGAAYGYTSTPVDTSDPDTRWKKVIDPEQAQWVSWIFARYAEGMGAKTIAGELNRIGVPSPGAKWKRSTRRSDGKWQHSAILGMAARGSGILRNELYIGRVIWNRSEWIKRPGSSTRTYRLRPREDWIIEEHPELRIVPQALWDQVQSRLSHKRAGGTHKGRRGTYLLTGVLKCADCGGSLAMIDQRCYGCGTRNRGGDAACDNPVRIRRQILEERFLAGIREQLLDERVIRWAEREVAKRLRRPKSDARQIAAELANVGEELEHIVNAISKVGISAALETKLKSLELRQRELQTSARSVGKAVAIPDGKQIGAKWRKAVERLAELPKTMNPMEIQRSRNAIRSFLGEVRVDRDGRAYADLSLRGLLPANVVAGARFGHNLRPESRPICLLTISR